jgi:chorismate mutase
MYIERVSESKWNSGSPIEDPEREIAILNAVGKKAENAGLPAAWTEHFFRLQIEASKVVEYQDFAQWRDKGQGAFPHASNLNTELRPHLDGITDALISALSREWPVIKSSSHHGLRCSDSMDLPNAWALAMTPLLDRSAELGSVPKYGMQP